MCVCVCVCVGGGGRIAEYSPIFSAVGLGVGGGGSALPHNPKFRNPITDVEIQFFSTPFHTMQTKKSIVHFR